jgi:hypothetical protein
MSVAHEISVKNDDYLTDGDSLVQVLHVREDGERTIISVQDCYELGRFFTITLIDLPGWHIVTSASST